MALFPTQKSTWQLLQKNTKTQNNCGRPGINGGYIDNPYMRFGVNCYGQKPTPSASELHMMNAKQMNPITFIEEEIDEDVQYWKDNLDLLQINPFNISEWSERNKQTGPVSNIHAPTNPISTLPKSTTAVYTTPASTIPTSTIPRSTTAVYTTPASTTPASTTPASTTPASTTPASTTSNS
jgi:hypothetical protein